MSELLSTVHDGDISILTLQRADRRNALNVELCQAILTAVQTAVADGSRAIVVTGEGTAFCAGADLDAVYGDEFLTALYTMLHEMARTPVPIIAAVNGPAIGAGTQLAIACDLRVVDERAKFAVPTAGNGMAVDGWTIRTLAELAGHGRARRVLLAADSIDQTEAIGCGLADRTGNLAEAISWAHQIANLAPLAIAHNKLVVNGVLDDDEVSASFTAVWASEDVKEASLARAEKRTPIFKGI
ncbi:MAG TPA: enoyl-CoA hydratase [Aeromicrobium sp.]|nr:enoyl-CoA hydratase [Aeromicrobium sp.]